MRGRIAGLLPIESAILGAGIAFQKDGNPEFYGFLVSSRLREQSGGTLFATHGALYKALDRLEKRGYLESRWEDAEIALTDGRPRRRLYRVTSAGALAATAEQATSAFAPATKPALT